MMKNTIALEKYQFFQYASKDEIKNNISLLMTFLSLFNKLEIIERIKYKFTLLLFLFKSFLSFLANSAVNEWILNKLRND